MGSGPADAAEHRCPWGTRRLPAEPWREDSPLGLDSSPWYAGSLYLLVLQSLSLSNHSSITLQSSSITLQSLFNHSSITLQSLFNHSSITLQSLFSHSSIALQPFFSHSSTILLQTFFNHSSITLLQSLFNHSSITLQSHLPSLFKPFHHSSTSTILFGAHSRCVFFFLHQAQAMVLLAEMAETVQTPKVRPFG
jgi:hypothetical protein